jgi:hypothetical protein
MFEPELSIMDGGDAFTVHGLTARGMGLTNVIAP